MHYMIIDEAANAVDSFEDRAQAVRALEALVAEDIEAADSLLLLAYDDDGNPVGEAVTASVIAPASSTLPASQLIVFATQRLLTVTGGITKGMTKLRPGAWYRQVSTDPEPGNSPLPVGATPVLAPGSSVVPGC